MLLVRSRGVCITGQRYAGWYKLGRAYIGLLFVSRSHRTIVMQIYRSDIEVLKNTFVEAENVRHMYQPLEKLYTLLITKRYFCVYNMYTCIFSCRNVHRIGGPALSKIEEGEP